MRVPSFKFQAPSWSGRGAWLLAASMVVAAGMAQQRADPDFDTSVPKPALAKSRPKVLFDNAHFNFHTSDGRYKPFVDLIRNDGAVVTPNSAKFSKETLAGYDVLVIANALGAAMNDPEAGKSAFTESECDAVRDWVRAGGSLLLITDHAPMGAAAESLGLRFGVNMSKVVTVDAANGTDVAGRLVFSRQNGGIGEHPISAGITRILTFTGQSLQGPAGSVALLKFADSAVDIEGRGPNARRTSAARRSQGLALEFGKGRVVVLGEAAMMSAQISGGGADAHPMGMNVPGIDNRQFALNVVRWLARAL